MSHPTALGMRMMVIRVDAVHLQIVSMLASCAGVSAGHDAPGATEVS